MSLVPVIVKNCLLAAGVPWRVQCNSKAESCGNIQDFQVLVVLVQASLNPVPVPCELLFSKIASQLCSGEGYENHTCGALPEGPECLAGLIHPHHLLFL